MAVVSKAQLVWSKSQRLPNAARDFSTDTEGQPERPTGRLLDFCRERRGCQQCRQNWRAGVAHPQHADIVIVQDMAGHAIEQCCILGAQALSAPG